MNISGEAKGCRMDLRPSLPIIQFFCLGGRASPYLPFRCRTGHQAICNIVGPLTRNMPPRTGFSTTDRYDRKDEHPATVRLRLEIQETSVRYIIPLFPRSKHHISSPALPTTRWYLFLGYRESLQMMPSLKRR